MSDRAVIFDLGQVVVQWQPERALSHLFETEEEAVVCLNAIGFEAWNVEQDRGRSREEGLSLIAREQPENLEIFTAYLDNLYDAHCNPVPGTAALMHRLVERGHILLALTNAQVASVDAIRKAIPEMVLFQDVLISAEEKLLKPDAEIFNRLLRRNQLSADQVLFIDDSPRNVAGAQNAGLDAVLFSGAAGLEQDLIKRGLL